jgi:hypothetical protein
MISLQPWSSWEKLATALSNRATLQSFTAAESAGVHALPGASVFMNSVILDRLPESLNFTQAYALHNGLRNWHKRVKRKEHPEPSFVSHP